MGLKKIIDNNFIENYFPFIPRLASKYNSFAEDFKNIFYYYFLGKRKFKLNQSIDFFIIFPTTFCNANCVYCANRCLKDKRSFLDFRLFKKTVDNLKNMGIKRVSLTPSPGEALLDKNLFKKMEYLKRNGFQFGFYTNAMSFKGNIEGILNSGISQIYIDLGDVIPEIDSKIFGISLEKSRERLEQTLNFIRKADLQGKKIKINLSFRGKRKPKEILKSLNKTEFGRYHKIGIFSVSFLQAYDNWGGQIKTSDLLGIQTLKRAPKFKKYPCENLFTFSLLPNGDIRLCGCRFKKTLNDELVVGNIHKQSLQDILDSGAQKMILQKFIEGEIPEVCKDCSFYRARIN